MGEFAGAPLEGLLKGNNTHVESLREDTYIGLEDEQHPDVVAVCCADSRVPQERMWGIDHPGTLFTPSTIGNQCWDVDREALIVDGGISYAVHHAGVEAIAVVGHTGCGAVAGAYQLATTGQTPGPRGVDLWLEQLRPVIEEALEDDLVDTAAAKRQLINQLVEWNVDAQVRFLTESTDLPSDMPVYGFVYDFQRAYGDEIGRCYLVNLDGITEPTKIAEAVPDTHSVAVRSLLW